MATHVPVLSERRSPAWVWAPLPLLLFAVSVAVTEPAFTGDTPFYADHVLKVRAGQMARTTEWEFGHILWRPLADALTPLFLAWAPGATPLLKVIHGLTAINLAAFGLATLLMFDLCRRLARPAVALLCSLAFVWGDAMLAYGQSGTCYVPAVALLVAGLWWEIVWPEGRWSGTGPAVLFGLAPLLWFPFVLVIPAAVAARKLVRLPETARARVSWVSVFGAAALSGAVAAGGVAGAALLAGVRTVPDFREWMSAASHDWAQNRQWMRAVSGCARLLVDLSRDGVLLKRFALRDPYNPVSPWSMAAQSLWKVGLFWAFAAAVGWLALAERKSRPALAVLLAAAVPMLFFAIFLFEPSSPERFLPVLPFLLMALAAGWGAPGRVEAAARATAIAFCLLLPVVNWPSFAGARSAERREARAQVEDFRTHAKPGDVLVTVTPNEPPAPLLLDPYEAPADVRFGWAMNVAEAKAEGWREQFDRFARETWARGGDVWVSAAAVADRPRAESGWVEGDHPRIRWKDVPAFFRGYEYDARTARPDGFMRIRRR